MAAKPDHFTAMAESLRQMRAIERGELAPGKRFVAADVLGPERAALIEARKRTGLSQAQFAAVLNVSARTLQDWEQGRRQPTGAARTLIHVAAEYPEAVLAVTSHKRPATKVAESWSGVAATKFKKAR